MMSLVKNLNSTPLFNTEKMPTRGSLKRDEFIQKRIFIINIWRVFGAGEWKIHKEPGRLSKGAQNDFKASFAIE